MTISALGTGSGLDLEGLVTTLIKSQTDAKGALYTKRESQLTVELSSVGTIKAAMESFQSSIKKLNDETLFTSRKATVDQPSTGDVFTVEANESASEGSYAIEVKQLAQGSRSESSAGLFTSDSDVVSATGGDLTFTAGTKTFSISVAAGTTLSELREQINDSGDNFGVSANLVDTGTGDVRLVLNSSVTGDGNSLVISNNDASLDNVSSVATGGGAAGISINGVQNEAKNGIIEIDSIEIQSTTNSFDNAVSGLTINATKVSEAGVTTKASVATDKETVKSTIETFIKDYNALMSIFDKETAIGGPMNGSSLIRGVESSLSNNLMKTFAGAGDFSTIFDIGVKIDNSGKLSLDSSEFEEAMDSGFDDISALFAGDTGLGKVLEDSLEPYVGTEGLIEGLKDSINDSIKQNKESREGFEYRMGEYEKTLRSQFSSLDVSLARMNSQGSALLSSLSNLPSYSNKS